MNSGLVASSPFGLRMVKRSCDSRARYLAPVFSASPISMGIRVRVSKASVATRVYGLGARHWGWCDALRDVEGWRLTVNTAQASFTAELAVLVIAFP